MVTTSEPTQLCSRVRQVLCRNRVQGVRAQALQHSLDHQADAQECLQQLPTSNIGIVRHAHKQSQRAQYRGKLRVYDRLAADFRLSLQVK